MLSPQFILPLVDELVVDLFAGGGGASTGIELAIGRHVDVAVNHDPEAVGLHAVNHPQTRHYCEDVLTIDPLSVTGGRSVGLMWASPDCKHFSKAKGGKPVSKKIRGLAWVVVRWARAVRPRVICLENVEEFQDWGPLGPDSMPCPIRKGRTFRQWKGALAALGYRVEHRELRACDFGAPTSRKRLFVVARCDGEPIAWPSPTHGPGLRPYRTAADCIDWSIPVPSIFDRARPLAPATLRRIAFGVKRYVLEAARPFIVPVTHQGDARVHSVDDPLRTVTSAQRGEFALAAPTLIQTGYGERPGQSPRVPGLHKPLGTAVDGQKHALVAAFLAQHNTGNVGHAATDPVSTIVGKGCTQGLVTSNLVKLRGTSNAAATDAPLATVSAGGTHHAEVRAFLVRYFGTDQDPRVDAPLATVTTKHRDALVTVVVDGTTYVISDIGLRMLQPRELYRAQGFPESYVIDRAVGRDGRWLPLTKSAQVRMVGNSVCPPVAAALVRANYCAVEALAVAA